MTMTEAERQAQERVDKAERINEEVARRMAQPLTPPGAVVKDESAVAPKKVLRRKSADE